MAGPEKGARATVARGRTVSIDGKTYGPGEEVSLAPAEIAQLRKSGFLTTPGEVELPRGEGPMFSPSDGPTIKVA
ncbi:hypothetical protein B0G84_4992 [Paraburkholderia sp. BL8N3]|nr:hypothetical protein [Paraburkholderia sp. BL8N3]TCK39652.1 hypothetical protein B0G84_4992 [Paraburkholderia sp. BL8N3]